MASERPTKAILGQSKTKADVDQAHRNTAIQPGPGVPTGVAGAYYGGYAGGYSP